MDGDVHSCIKNGSARVTVQCWEIFHVSDLLLFFILLLCLFFLSFPFAKSAWWWLKGWGGGITACSHIFYAIYINVPQMLRYYRIIIISHYYYYYYYRQHHHHLHYCYYYYYMQRCISVWPPQNTCVVSCNLFTHFTCLGPFHKTAYSDQLTHAVNLHHILQITCLVALFVYVVVTLPQPGRTKPTNVTSANSGSPLRDSILAAKDAKRQPSKHRCIEKYSFKLIGSYMVPFVTCRANCTAKVVSWTIPNTGKTILIVNDCY